MSVIGTMKYLTIGNSTYEIPGGEGTVTSVGLTNATNGGLTISGGPITSSGSITVGHTNVLTSAQTTQAVYPIKIDKNGHISEYGSAVTIPVNRVISVAEGQNAGNIRVGTVGNDGTASYTDVPVKNLKTVATSGSYNDLTDKPTIPTVPTNVSAFTNDAGYLTSYTETDPTVPNWAKASSKPSYTAAEVGAVPTTRTVNGKALSTDITLSASDVSALPSSTVIPSKTSDITNDSGFITSPNVVYCTCTTAKATAAKVATIVSGTLTTLNAGDQAIVKFTNSNTSASPTLKIGNTDAKSIMRYGATVPSASAETSWNAGSPILFVYDGTYWVMCGFLNSVYYEISEANITNATGSTAGLVTGRRAKSAVEAFAPVTSVNGQTGAVTVSTDNIFYADYEATSYADINAAIDAGKEVILRDATTQASINVINYYHLHWRYTREANYKQIVFADSTNYVSIENDGYEDIWSEGTLEYRGLSFTDGTHYIFLEAPNAIANTDKTIVLPDKSGTIALTNDIPSVPTKTSDLTNDSGFITSTSVPTKTSDLTNDSGFITSASVPTKISDLTNDSGLMAFNDLVIEEYTKAYSNIAGGGNFSWDESVSKSGYYPVGVVGFNAARAGLCCEFAFITDVAIGSCTLRMHAKNTTSSSIQANTAKIYVLWIKV